MVDPSVVATARAMLRAGPSMAVKAVEDGDTIVLSDGTELRLVGTQAPKLPLGRKGFVEWPLAKEAREALAGIASGRRLALMVGGRAVDRHGRHLAHAFTDTGLWVQGEMLARGWSRVYTFPDNVMLAAQMLRLEDQARQAGRGIWSHPAYRVRRPEQTLADIGGYHLVEGQVIKANRTRKGVFLDFGPDWRRDFAARIDTADLAHFREAKLDPLSLEGQWIRVRGWIVEGSGPEMAVSHPQQIERIDPPSSRREGGARSRIEAGSRPEDRDVEEEGDHAP